MASLDRKQKKCCTSCSLQRPWPCCVDRLTSLPDELVTRILSMLPTKDAAAAQVLSKRMRRAFCWITNLDLDNSPVSHYVEHPHLVERFSRFESFTDNVLHKLSQYQQPLTRFRLCLGSDKTLSYCFSDKACFPEPARLYTWISYPLAQCGLRELDLCFHVKNPAECKLPPEIFARQSLEVLRLDINVEINGDTEIPVICLPNLKLLDLRSLVFTEDEFVTRLVSNCPALEDLSITCWWLKADRLIISSNSLRRFVFIISKYHDEEKNSDLVHIDTPNLQYFKYADMLAFNYILHLNLNALVEACIYVIRPLGFDSFETSFRKQLSLFRALSNVKQLSLLGWSIEGFYYAAKLMDPLPMFRNLRTLKLSSLCDGLCSARWDIVLMLIFHRTPLLEELVFQGGFCDWVDNDDDPSHPCYFHDPDRSDNGPYVAAWEALSWGITQTTIPPCCEFHLKRIRIYNCHGRDQELNMMGFLLGKTSVLKEFVISMSKRPKGILFDSPKLDQFKNKLEEIPRASNSCSIIYSDDDEPNYN